MNLLKTALLSLTLISATISADTTVRLQPLQAHTVSLPEHTAVIYYIALSNGNFEVVSTVAPNIGVNSVASQQRTQLSPGQTFSMSFDNDQPGDSIQTFEITAVSGMLQIARR